MSNEMATAYLSLIFPFGIIFVIMLIAYEDGVPCSMWNKIRCKMGKHRFKSRWGNVPKYYCQNCKKPREHPVLKLIVGNKNKLIYKG